LKLAGDCSARESIDRCPIAIRNSQKSCGLSQEANETTNPDIILGARKHEGGKDEEKARFLSRDKAGGGGRGAAEEMAPRISRGDERYRELVKTPPAGFPVKIPPQGFRPRIHPSRRSAAFAAPPRSSP